jgi:hypothetical protein
MTSRRSAHCLALCDTVYAVQLWFIYWMYLWRVHPTVVPNQVVNLHPKVRHASTLHLNLTHPHPSSPASIVRSPPPHLYPPVSVVICSSPVARLSRASTAGEKNSGEPEQAPGRAVPCLVPNSLGD